MPRIPLDRLDVPDWADDLKPLDPHRVGELAARAGVEGAFAEPLHVLADGDRFVLVDGRHRALAAREAGWAEIEAVVHGAGDAGDALALAIAMHGAELTPETARRLSAWLSVHGAARAPSTAALDGPRRRLLRELLAFLHARKRVQDARLAQLFDLGDAAAAARLRVDERGLPPLAPMGLHEMPEPVTLAVRELCAEGLLAREEVEHLFPLNERERLHLKAERALRALTAGEAERVKLKGSRWGPDYRSGGPQRVRVLAEWPDGRRAELDLDEVPGLDRHTKGIIARAFVGLLAKGAGR